MINQAGNMKFLAKFKKIGKYLVGIAGAAFLISQLILPAISMNAGSPRFNFLDGDYEMFKGLNYSKGEDVWKDPVSGEAGDTFSGYIYYHNGIENETAVNTRIKVSVPSKTTNKTAKLDASISADNAQTITDTVVNGKIVGLSGLTVNLDQDADVEFIKGSVKWYPNKSDSAVSLPFGQSGDEILSSSGLNIGDIQGCWDYSGFITFAFKTKTKVVPANLTLQKTVKNVSKGQTSFVESVSAAKSEKVQFKIETANNGGSDAENVVVSDLLPADLSVVPGSAKLDKSGVLSNISEANLLASGVNIGNLAVGEKATILFEATAPASIAVAKTVVNTAKVTSGNINLSDTAEVCLEAGVVNIVKSKSAFNQTQNVDATTRGAGPGDTIEYTLVTKNTGNLDTDYLVSDGVADILEYADIVNISDGGSQVNGTTGNDAILVNYPSVKITAGGEIVRKFTVKVKDPLPNNPADGFHFDDKMFNVYGNEVIICIARPIPVIKVADLRIDKFVRDVTRNELDYVKINTAYAGDVLEYKITFENVGNAPADYVKISDVLPANVVLDTSVPAVLSVNGVEHSIAEDITSGYVIATIMPGDQDYIRFRVLTSKKIAANEHLVNTGYLTDNDKVISAQAETVIKQTIIPAAVVEALPKTGAPLALEISALASLLTTANIALIKKKKVLFKAARKIKFS